MSIWVLVYAFELTAYFVLPVYMVELAHRKYSTKKNTTKGIRKGNTGNRG